MIMMLMRCCMRLNHSSLRKGETSLVKEKENSRGAKGEGVEWRAEEGEEAGRRGKEENHT